MMDNQKNLPGTLQVENRVVDHKQAAIQFLKLIETGQIEEAYRRYAAANGKHHNPYFQAGFPALQKGMQENHDQFPNMRLTVKNVIGDGDLVAIHSQVVQSPGEAGVAAVHIFRFQADKIVEFWDVGEPVPADSPNEDGIF
ncbi:MAG: nuclear transport factor 2 family protein [Anaerolineales bacterium]